MHIRCFLAFFVTVTFSAKIMLPCSGSIKLSASYFSSFFTDCFVDNTCLKSLVDSTI